MNLCNTLLFTLISKLQTNYDIFELQSSDESPSIAIFIPKRLSSKNRITGEILVENVAKQLNRTLTQKKKRRRIPKLLLPKSLRPAMYSLDGFVPRPSNNRITSTEAPTTENEPKFMSRRHKKLNQTTDNKENKSKRVMNYSIDKISVRH